MAIQRRENKNGTSWRVYWIDPMTKKQKNKSFSSYQEAFNFNLVCKNELLKFRKKYRVHRSNEGKDIPSFPERAIVPFEAEDLPRFKQKCMELYCDPTNRVADMFDFIMEAMGLPIRFKDVLNTAKNSKRGNIPAKLRAAILARDNYRCRMCGATAEEAKLHIDHIVPVSRGGITEERNLQTLCEKCNLGKRNFSIQ